MRPIAYYAHHQGHGHLVRAGVICRHLHRRAAVLTSATDTGEARALTDQGIDVVPLPIDHDPDVAQVDRTARGALQFAPLDSPLLGPRAKALVDWFVEERPALVVVDVSVEVTVLARLAGIPSVAVRLHGRRDDRAHTLGYDCASSLLAPWPEWLEDPSTPADVARRTIYTGTFSRFDHRIAAPASLREAGRVVVLGGGGDDGLEASVLDRLAAATPEWTWHVMGAVRGRPKRVQALGWVDDPFHHLRTAEVAVVVAGDNAIAEAAAARTPMVCVPRARPCDEQVSKSLWLSARGAAVMAPPLDRPPLWGNALARALEIDRARLMTLNDGRGARRAAEHLESVAARFDPVRTEVPAWRPRSA